MELAKHVEYESAELKYLMSLLPAHEENIPNAEDSKFTDGDDKEVLILIMFLSSI